MNPNVILTGLIGLLVGCGSVTYLPSPDTCEPTYGITVCEDQNVTCSSCSGADPDPGYIVCERQGPGEPEVEELLYAEDGDPEAAHAGCVCFPSQCPKGGV